MMEVEVFLLVGEAKKVTGENSYSINWRPLNVAITEAEAEAQATEFRNNPQFWLRDGEEYRAVDVVSRYVPF